MSMTPPPGWYRDPSYPLVERWWGRTAWTDHRRRLEVPQVSLVPPELVSDGPGRVKSVALTAADHARPWWPLLRYPRRSPSNRRPKTRPALSINSAAS
ncbi:DUF2510 domain-containing protein [Streptomyces sp. NPDC093544]|uniref:DUF2510 domain-containing protein n=1 Tax=Streptomyces sp. NPDC093544 TaxID=3155200 RepID=UPI00341EF0F0